MKPGIYSSCIIILIVVFYTGACRQAGLWLVEEDDPVHADAIVILMGSVSDRVLQASDLYKQGKAGAVIMVEVSLRKYKELKARGEDIISNTDQSRDASVALGIPLPNIRILPGDATSTLTEAMIVREYLANNPGIDTLLLVSSAPHTRRASMIFKSAFRKAKTPVYIFSSPSHYTDFNAQKWWRSRELLTGGSARKR